MQVRCLALGLIFGLGLLLPGQVLAADPQPIDGTIAVVEDRLTLDADVSSLVLRELADKLGDGLPHTVRIRITLLAHATKAADTPAVEAPAPLSLTLRTCRLVFDLWGERYAVRVKEGTRRIERWSDTPEGAARICGQLEGITLAPLGTLDLRRNFQVSLRVKIDPRHARPEGGGRPYFGDPLAAGGASRPGGTFFGAMARAFYREEDSEEDPGTLFESPLFGEALIRAAMGDIQKNGNKSPPQGTPEGEEE